MESVERTNRSVTKVDALTAQCAAEVTLVKLRSVTVRYGATTALDGVDFTVRSGEVSGLVGLNGSGKSTLVKVLAGSVEPERGDLWANGRQLALPITPKQREQLGWGFVFQDLALLQNARVVDSFLAESFHASRKWWVRDRAEVRWVQAVLDGLGVPVSAHSSVSSLSPAEQAMAAIARAAVRLERKCEIAITPDVQGEGGRGKLGLLVLDEPTAVLPGDEAELVYKLVRRLTSRGHGVVLVSHHLDEIIALADRVTVLVDGKVRGTVEDLCGESEDLLVDLMVGGRVRPKARSDSTIASRGAALPGADCEIAVNERLVVSGLSGARLCNVDFHLLEGEILGVTGTVGAGHEELPYLLFGARPWKAGRFCLNGRDYRGATWDIVDAVAAGVGLVPGNRAESGVGEMAVRENISLPSLSEFSHLSLVSRGREQKESARLLAEMSIKAESPRANLSSLSGGNQQKVALAKWLRREPTLLLLHEPTQGVDVGARAEIHGIIKDAATRGMSVVWSSNDFDELEEVCDRVVVFAAGAVRAELTKPLSAERIGRECLVASWG